MIKTKPSFLFLAGLSVVTALSVGLFGVETAQAGCGWLDITCKDSGIRQTGRDIDPTGPNFAENQWGNAGGAGYPAAAKWMRANNGSSQGWDEYQNSYLRPHFGSLLDQVAVIYNANLMDEWSALGMRVNLDNSAAQTYCNRIYVDDPYKPNDSNQLALLAHELTHSKQCQQLGGAGKFGFHYFREFKRANQNYENNKLEKEAFDFENYFVGWQEEQIASSSEEAQINADLIAEEANRPLLIPLALYWNGQIIDNATVATLAMRRSQEKSGYAGPNIQGCVFSRQEPNTVPLYLFWHQQKQDNATVATPEMIQSQIDSGYGNPPAIQGYIYPTQQSGTIPLYLFWHQQKQDNATVATPEMIQSQIDSGYGNPPAIQGYIYPADKCR